MVGARRFELRTSCSQSRRATSLRHAPMTSSSLYVEARAHLSALLLCRRCLAAWKGRVGPAPGANSKEPVGSRSSEEPESGYKECHPRESHGDHPLPHIHLSGQRSNVPTEQLKCRQDLGKRCRFRLGDGLDCFRPQLAPSLIRPRIGFGAGVLQPMELDRQEIVLGG